MFFNLFALPALLSSIFNISIGSFILFKNMRKKQNQIFAFSTMFIFMFCLGESLLRSSSTIEEATIFGKIAYLGAIFIPLSIVHFSFVFPKKSTNASINYKEILIIFYIIGMILFMLFNYSFSPDFIHSSKWGYRLEINNQPIFIIISLWIGILSFIGIRNFYKNFFDTNDLIKKKQITNILIGTLIIIFFTFSTNILPPLLNLEILPLGSVSLGVFSLFIASSIQRYSLLIYRPMTESVLDKSKLLSLNRNELEKEVTARTKALLESNKELKRALSDKEVLLKEIHHRVKNNLQVISSLLKLQSESIGDEDIIEKFKESMNRVRSMALIHDKIYRSDSLNQVDFNEYLTNLIHALFHSYNVSSNTISLSISSDDVYLDLDAAISCGLIVNELVSNSLKHGFPEGKSGEISVKVSESDGKYMLVIRDTGIGLPDSVNINHPESLGLQLVYMLVEQLEGSVSFENKHGLVARILFSMDAVRKQ